MRGRQASLWPSGTGSGHTSSHSQPDGGVSEQLAKCSAVLCWRWGKGDLSHRVAFLDLETHPWQAEADILHPEATREAPVQRKFNQKRMGHL